MRTLLALSLAFAAMLGGPSMAQVKSEAVNSGHVEAQLVSQDAGAVPGQTIYLGLSQKITKDWHTYWRNPGDSGEATQIVWTLPPGWSSGEIVWPAPRRLPVGPLVNYGFSDSVILPVPVMVPASARPGETANLKAAVTYLVCKDVCIPESAVLQIAVPVVAGAVGPDAKWGAAVAKTVAEAPRPAALKAAFNANAEAVNLSIAGAPLAGADMAGAYFYPYKGDVIDHAGEQKIERGPQGLTLAMKASTALTQVAPPESVSGVLSLASGAAYEITATQGDLLPEAAGLGAVASAGNDEGGAGGGAGPGGAPLGLIAAAAFAFIGGLILNLMPCVFPVLSMKAAALASHASEHRAVRAQGLAFMGGVLATFLLLGGMLIAVRAAGEGVGWGFQLQSPAVVASLALIMLLTALNLSGVFEIGTSVQGVGSGLASKGGLAGAAFTGALAVVVAAPCTAPFMAPALGFALTQPPAVAMIVFLALGLGMAAPFTLLAFLPGLLSRIPRPGPWMDTFKKTLAFPMYGAAAWLVWVLAQQTDSTGLARLLAAAVVVALGAWLYGKSQSMENSKAKHIGLMAGGLAGLALAVSAAVALPYDPIGGGQAAEGAIEKETYDPARLAELRSAGVPVFVDFTAAWCVTCKVNEGGALASAKVADAFKRTDTVYMVGDWTNQDEGIAKVLAQYGRAGVPLYLMYGADGKDAKVLPQLLSQKTVIKALEAAAA